LLVFILAMLFCASAGNAEAQTGSLPPGNWCCEGWVGDIDGSGAEDITDISVMIDNMFLTLTALKCWGEADFNGDYSVDITDLQMLISAQFFCDKSSLKVVCFPDCAPPPPAGSLVSQTGCKGELAAAAPEDYTPDQSCIVWDYDGTGTLAITHVNAGFNCCPVLDISVDVQDGTITLYEIETEGQCDCLCLYDLDYEVTSLPPGVYRIVTDETYFVPGMMEALDFTVDLSSTPQGVHCVERTIGPWHTP